MFQHHHRSCVQFWFPWINCKVAVIQGISGIWRVNAIGREFLRVKAASNSWGELSETRHARRRRWLRLGKLVSTELSTAGRHTQVTAGVWQSHAIAHIVQLYEAWVVFGMQPGSGLIIRSIQAKVDDDNQLSQLTGRTCAPASSAWAFQAWPVFMYWSLALSAWKFFHPSSLVVCQCFVRYEDWSLQYRSVDLFGARVPG